MESGAVGTIRDAAEDFSPGRSGDASRPPSSRQRVQRPSAWCGRNLPPQRAHKFKVGTLRSKPVSLFPTTSRTESYEPRGNWLNSESSTCDADQISQFAVNVFRPGDRAGDFRPQKFTEALAEPMHRHFHAPFGEVQMCGNLCVRSCALVAPYKTLEVLEPPGFVRLVEFLTQSGQHLLDQRDRPALVKLGVRIGFIRRLRRIPILRRVRVNGKKLQPPAAFQTARPLPFVD